MAKKFVRRVRAIVLPLLLVDPFLIRLGRFDRRVGRFGLAGQIAQDGLGVRDRLSLQAAE